ncbi:MAG: hypothetical protein ACLGIA_08910 [Actinomycetes bacterium]
MPDQPARGQPEWGQPPGQEPAGQDATGSGWGDVGPAHELWGEGAASGRAPGVGAAGLAIADLLDGAIRAIRENLWPLLVATAVVVTVLTVLDLLVLLPVAGWLLGRPGLAGVALDDRVLDARSAGEAAVLVGVGETGSRVAVLAGTLLVSGVLAPGLTERVPGSPPVPVTARGLLSGALRRIGPLVGSTALVAAGVVLGAALGALPGLLLAMSGGDVAVLLGGLLALAGGFAGFVLALLLWGVRTCLAPQAVALQGSGGRAALGRSMRLVRGRYWRVVGVLALGTVLTWVVQGLVSAPFATLNAVVASAPDVQLSTLLGLSPLQLAITGVGVVVSTTLAFPVLAAVLTALFDALVREAPLEGKRR